jgi:DNA gyrase/topoisomerase IV subunit B
MVTFWRDHHVFKMAASSNELINERANECSFLNKLLSLEVKLLTTLGVET